MAGLLDFTWLHFDVDFSSFTLEDLDHPLLNEIYCIYWDVILVFTTAFFILMLYTIIKKSSKEMGGYKWYLVHQLCWSYAFDLYMGLWKPIPLWPFHLGYSGGIFSQLPSRFSIVPLLAVTFFAVGMGFGIFVALIHRYVQGRFFIWRTRGIREWVGTGWFPESSCFLKGWVRLAGTHFFHLDKKMNLKNIFFSLAILKVFRIVRTTLASLFHLHFWIPGTPSRVVFPPVLFFNWF